MAHGHGDGTKGTLVLKQLDIGGLKQSIWSARPYLLVRGVDATPITEPSNKKGSRQVPSLFSSAAYFDSSFFNFTVRAGRTSL